jgi:hypothetical protein
MGCASAITETIGFHSMEPIPADQPDPTRLGELLCGRKLRRVLSLHQRLGGEEDQAPFDEGSETTGLRLDAVE